MIGNGFDSGGPATDIGSTASDSTVSEVLLSCWRDHRPERLNVLFTSVKVPGALALRSRYESLVDLSASDTEPGGFDIGADLWDRQIKLMAEGDAALSRNDQLAAAHAFTALRDSHIEGQHPLPLIDAYIGLAEVARQADRTDEAIKMFAEALQLARRHHCRFAEVRAGLALGYTRLLVGSAGAAEHDFTSALTIARERDWRLDVANAQVGRGECRQRRMEFLPALHDLLDGLQSFEQLRSPGGIANATVQLGELCRRHRMIEDAHGWYQHAIEHSARSGFLIALANALDGLAEIEIEMGRIQSARRHLGRAARVSGQEYSRGYAHALNGLARCAFRERKWATALSFFDNARRAYIDLEVWTAAASSCAGIATTAEILGEPQLALDARIEAVQHIENSRAGQLAHSDQAEYFDRFGSYYSAALQAALTVGDVVAFVAVFEAMAGRRLAGLIDTNDATAGNAQLLAQLARINHQVRTGEEDYDDDPIRRHNRIIGRIALGSTLPEMARQAFDDTIAPTYRAFDVTGADQLWRRCTQEHSILLLLAEGGMGRGLTWLLHRVGHAPEGGITTFPDGVADVLESLRTNGLPMTARPSEIAALASLLPPELLRLLPTGERVTIVPTGRLWAVPWPAVPAPTDERPDLLLTERGPLVLSPSLAVSGHLAGTQLPARPVGSIAWWRSAQVERHDVRAFHNVRAEIRVTRLSEGTSARNALLNSSTDMLVIVAHGRPLPHLVHFIDLDDAVPITPADMLLAQPPREVALIACWGAAAPGAIAGDPVSVVTLALIRGTHSIASTTSELLDDSLSSTFVNTFLRACLTEPIPEALHRTTVRFLARPEFRQGYLSRWAPLSAFGS